MRTRRLGERQQRFKERLLQESQHFHDTVPDAKDSDSGNLLQRTTSKECASDSQPEPDAPPLPLSDTAPTVSGTAFNVGVFEPFNLDSDSGDDDDELTDRAVAAL